MIKFLVKLKKYLLSNIKIRKLVHYKKELNSNDSFAYQSPAGLNGDASFQHISKASQDIVNLFNFEGKPLIEEHTACIVVRVKDEPAGCIFFDLYPIAKLSYPFKYELKLDSNSAYIHGIFVEKKFRGQGLAKLLYIKAFKALEGKFKHAHALTEEENFVSNNMVNELGFKRINCFDLIKIFNFKINYSTNNAFEKFLLGFLMYLVKKTYHFIRLPVTILEKISVKKNERFFKLFILSDLKSDGAITVAHFCRNNFYLPLAKRIFPDGYEIKNIIKFLKSDLENKISEVKKQVDLLIVEDDLSELYKRFKHIEDIKFIPKLVLQKNDSIGEIEGLISHKSRSLHTDFNIVLRNKYEYIFSKDFRLLEFFYKNMYVSYISNRHKQTAFITPFNLVLKSFNKGGLILLKQKNKFISGCVVELDKLKMNLKYFGVLNGDPSLLKRGALSSLYYFCFQFISENSFKAIDFGYSRGFLNDGVLRYKAKWGAEVEFDKKQGSTFLFKIINFTPSIKNFLLKNPFISMEKNKELVGNIFLDIDSQENKDICVNKLKVKGLNKFRVVYLNGLRNNLREEIVNLNYV